MNYEYYISSGVCKKPEGPGTLSGFAEVILYNPSDMDSKVILTSFFQNKESYTLEPVTVRAGRNYLLIMPDIKPEVFEDCGYWGGRFASTTPLVVEPIGGPSYSHAIDTFKGGCPNFWGTKLHSEWYFANGLWRVQQGQALESQPYNELEEYYFLNPGNEDVKVEMTLQFRDIEPLTINLTIPAQRLYVWSNFEKIPCNQPYGVKLKASAPITVSANRMIYGIRDGIAEWGLQAHSAMPGLPGPIRE